MARGKAIQSNCARLALPLGYTFALFMLSSIPGNISPEIPVGAVFQWVTPQWQNLLHIPIYAGLTLSWIWALEGQPLGDNARLLIALLLAVLWGVFEEFHQSHIPGRYGSLPDVTLNLLGAALATLYASRR